MTPLKPDKPTGKANGKVILLGEHAVVHGAHALAVGLPDRMTVEVEPIDGPIIQSSVHASCCCPVALRFDCSVILRCPRADYSP